MSHPKLEIEVIESMPFSENTYVARLAGRPDCVVVDPGFEPQKIVELVEERGWKPTAILNTHGHPDHIAGNGFVKDRWPECPIVIGRGEARMLTDSQENLSARLGVPITSPPADVLLDEGDIYETAGMRLEVYEIPGHSSGHIVFLLRDHAPMIVFGGDVLFAGSIGRTDFPGGSFERLADGIKQKLFTLPDDTIVLTGHGPETTVGEEKRDNPFVGESAGLYPLD